VLTYKELEDSETARRERAARLEAEPRPAGVPYYRLGRPAPELLARYWQRRALRAEAELRMWREADQIRGRKKQP
jgi:hypothetical protein